VLGLLVICVRVTGDLCVHVSFMVAAHSQENTFFNLLVVLEND